MWSWRAERRYALGILGGLVGCAQSSATFDEVGSCPSDSSRMVYLRENLEGSDATEGAAALASFETVTVSTDDAASLGLAASTFDLRADPASAVVYAMRDCGEGVWYARWELEAGDGVWGEPDLGVTASSVAAIDEATGDWYYSASIFREWDGGAPLDTFGVETGDHVGLVVSNDPSHRVADDSEIDATSPHWTLWESGEAVGDLFVPLASGAVTLNP